MTSSDALDTVERGTCLQVLHLLVPAFKRILDLLLGRALSIIVCNDTHKCLHMNISEQDCQNLRCMRLLRFPLVRGMKKLIALANLDGNTTSGCLDVYISCPV